jgi:hypothetical protein
MVLRKKINGSMGTSFVRRVVECQEDQKERESSEMESCSCMEFKTTELEILFHISFKSMADG